MSNQNPAIKRPQRNPGSATSLPRPTASTKKYRAPEPPGAGQEGNLASKLKVLYTYLDYYLIIKSHQQLEEYQMVFCIGHCDVWDVARLLIIFFYLGGD